MIPQTTLKDYRTKINILQVLVELGYSFDPSKGRSRPHYVKKDGDKVMDSLYVKDPQNNQISGYWRRNPGPGQREKGTVISLIMENITEFPEYAGARNEIDAVNKVCARLSNQPIDEKQLLANYAGRDKEGALRPFVLTDYDRILGDVDKSMRFFGQRGISRETAELFVNNFELIRDNKNTKVNWHNLGFPFRRPGEAQIVGYEVRGFGPFKAKAEGTDSTMGCWQVYLGKLGTPDNIPHKLIEQIHMAESAYDIMSYVQINRHKLDLDHSVFVSVGGAFTNNLMAKLLDTYSMAIPNLHFDNDLTGTLYDIRVAAVRAGKTLRTTRHDDMIDFYYGEKVFSIPVDKLTYSSFMKTAYNNRLENAPRIVIDKPLPQYKDFNEVLQTAMTADKTARKWQSPVPPKGSIHNPAQPIEEVDHSHGFRR